MGNLQSNVEKDSFETEYDKLNSDELFTLEQFFIKLCEKEKTVANKENFQNYFNSFECLIFSNSLFSYISPESDSLNFNQFRLFFVKVCRSNPGNAINCLWEILSINSGSLVTLDFLELFLRLVLEFGDCKEINIRANMSKRLADHYIRHLKRRFPKTVEVTDDTKEFPNDFVNIESIQQWINEYFPCTPKVIISYFSKICLKDLKTESLSKCYHAPLLNSLSCILSRYDLIPLALYSETLQSHWNKLYSTELDGASFNRVAHHILGFDVRLLHMIYIYNNTFLI